MDAIKELSYALDTFYFLVSGALVMWMAAGFAMLEAGLVRARHTAEILTKNIVLYSIACVMYLLCGYQIMYGDSTSAVLPSLGFLIGADNDVQAVVAGGEDAPYYSVKSDFFFQVVFVATAMSIVSGAVAERMKLWAFLVFAVFMTGLIYPVQGYWKWGGGDFCVGVCVELHRLAAAPADGGNPRLGGRRVAGAGLGGVRNAGLSGVRQQRDLAEFTHRSTHGVAGA